MWPVVEAIYVLIGGALSLILAPIHAGRLSMAYTGFHHVTAFVLVVGTIMLWPLLVALALDDGAMWK